MACHNHAAPGPQQVTGWQTMSSLAGRAVAFSPTQSQPYLGGGGGQARRQAHSERVRHPSVAYPLGTGLHGQPFSAGSPPPTPTPTPAHTHTCARRSPSLPQHQHVTTCHRSPPPPPPPHHQNTPTRSPLTSWVLGCVASRCAASTQSPWTACPWHAGAPLLPCAGGGSHTWRQSCLDPSWTAA